MNDKDFRLIKMINEYCRNICSFIENYDFQQFRTDLKTNSACVFFLEQIGESAGNLSKKFKETYNNLDWREMTRLRIRIAHHYRGIDLDIVWQTVNEDIPILLKFTDKILKTNIHEN
jgi:uncharacterized protein with HEPN domain